MSLQQTFARRGCQAVPKVVVVVETTDTTDKEKEADSGTISHRLLRLLDAQ